MQLEFDFPKEKSKPRLLLQNFTPEQREEAMRNYQEDQEELRQMYRAKETCEDLWEVLYGVSIEREVLWDF